MAMLRCQLSFVLLFIFAEKCVAQSPADIKFPEQEERWFQIKSSHFVLFSQAKQKDALKVIESLERLRKALVLLGNEADSAFAFPTSIYLFKTDKAFEPYILRLAGQTPNLAGYFLPLKDGNYIALSAQTHAMQVIYHEYIHSHTNHNLPGAPAWFSEGYAEYFSTFRSDNKYADVGLPVSEHLKLLQSETLIPLSDLFATDAGMVLYHDKSSQEIFYAQSWLLVHFLMHGKDGELRPKLWRYLKRLQNGEAEHSAFVAEFGIDHKIMLRQLQQYLSRNLFNYVELTSVELNINTNVQVEPMGYASVLSQLGTLLAKQDQSRHGLAKHYFKKALAVDSGQAQAHAGLGHILQQNGFPLQAIADFGAAVKYDSLNAWRYFQYAESQMLAHIRRRAQISRNEREVQHIALSARQSYQRAIQLDPHLYPAFAGLGETYLYHSERQDLGIAALQKAMKYLHGRMDIAINLMILFARNGDISKSDSLLNSVIRIQAEAYIYEQARRHRNLVELESANELLKSGKYKQAITVLDHLSTQPVADNMHQQIAHLRQVAQKNMQSEQYNRAMLYANLGKLQDAKTILIDLLNTLEDSTLKTSVEHALSEVKHGQDLEKYQRAMALFKDKKLHESATILRQIVADTTVDKRLASDAGEALRHIETLYEKQ